MTSSFVNDTSFPQTLAPEHPYSNDVEGGRIAATAAVAAEQPQMDFANEYGADGSWNPPTPGAASDTPIYNNVTAATPGSAFGSTGPLLFLSPHTQTQQQARPNADVPPQQQQQNPSHQSTSNTTRNTAPTTTASGDHARSAAASSAARELRLKREKFLVFTKVMLRYLEKKDPPTLTKVKAVIKECWERNKREDPGYHESVVWAMKTQIRATVSDYHWKCVETILRHFLEKKRQEQGLGRAGAGTQAGGIITTAEDDFGGHRFYPIQAANDRPVVVDRIPVAAQTDTTARATVNSHNNNSNNNLTTSVAPQTFVSRVPNPRVVRNNPHRGLGRRAPAAGAPPPKRQHRQPRVQGPSKTELHNDQEQDDDDGPACVICEDRKPNCIALPCAHLKFCVACARKMCFEEDEQRRGGDQPGKPIGQVQCPICRKDVTEMKRVYAD